MRVHRLLLSKRVAISLAGIAALLAILSVAVLLVNLISIDDIGEPPQDFNLRNGISFGVSSEEDFKGAFFTSPPSYAFCLNDDRSWSVVFTWILISEGAMPDGKVVLSVPSNTSEIEAEAMPFTNKNTGRELKSDRPVPQPEIVTTGNDKLIIYSPNAGPTAYSGGFSTAGTQIRFRLPSTQTRRNGLGEWDFRVIYNGRLGPTAEGIPATVGSARFVKSEGNSLSDGDNVKIVLCPRPFHLRSVHPDPTNEGIEMYSWMTPIVEDLVIDGRVYGGRPYMLRQAAPEVLVGVVSALLGALYGVALQPGEASSSSSNERRQKSGASKSPDKDDKKRPSEHKATPKGSRRQHQDKSKQ